MKFKEIMIYILIFVVGSLILSFLINYNAGSFSLKSSLDSIKSYITLKGTSETDFPCIKSLNEYLDIKRVQKGSSYKITLQETNVFSNKEDMASYLTKWGGEGTINVKTSIEKLDEINFPSDVALIHIERCVSLGCDSWFEWGICNGNNNTNFEKIWELAWL